MAAAEMPNNRQGQSEPIEPYHVYHAEAQVLGGSLKHPIEQPISHHSRAVLESRRAGHITDIAEEFSLEGLISVKSGHTRVSGAKVEKKDLWGNDHSGWVTLSTTVVEGLNVFEVITADRLVAQVSTEHAVVNGHVPKVTFLGTRFENLRVSGYPVELELDLEICGGKPRDNQSYFDDPDFLKRIEKQSKQYYSECKEDLDSRDLLETLEKEYDQGPISIDDVRKKLQVAAPVTGNGDDCPRIECSLVKRIRKIPIPGVKTVGNIIYIPDFGAVSLAGVEIGCQRTNHRFLNAPDGSGSESDESTYFTLRMLNMKLGCIGGGAIQVGQSKTNGNTRP